jgi:hypothetical protein
MAAKRWAQGTKVKRLNPVSSLYEEIPGLGDISGPDMTRDWLDLTAHDSPGGYEEGVPTILRTGEVRAPMAWDPANAVQAALLDDLNNSSIRTWRVVANDPAATYLQFQGYVTSLAHTFPVTGALSRNFAVRVTGLMSTGSGG